MFVTSAKKVTGGVNGGECLFVCAGNITLTKAIFNLKLPLVAVAEHCFHTCSCFKLDENLSGMFSGAVVKKMFNTGAGHCELLCIKNSTLPDMSYLRLLLAVG